VSLLAQLFVEDLNPRAALIRGFSPVALAVVTETLVFPLPGDSFALLSYGTERDIAIDLELARIRTAYSYMRVPLEVTQTGTSVT